MNRPFRGLLALALAAALAAAGCGKKGPLYLPDEQKQEQEKKQGAS